MRDTIESIQASEIICWRVINQSAVFGSDEQVAAQVELSSAVVLELGPRMHARTLDVGPIENQSAGPC